jgi:hypothetical protein
VWKGVEEMSILIKVMEMPECCGYCPFEYKNYCMAKPSLMVESADRHPRCPLVEIPPHGRLIDADELRELYEEWENDKEAGIDIDKCHVPIPVIRQNIDDAPTIIPAEEGE